MAQTSTLSLGFDRPPVIETRISVQFSPLERFRSGHFGLFWAECLSSADWRILPDAEAEAKEFERFGSKHLIPPGVKEPEDFPGVQMRLVNKTETRFVFFQPNKLRLTWKRGEDQRPRYEEVKEQLTDLFGQLELFAKKHSLGSVKANLWEIAYVNSIPVGELWSTPADWHEVLPGLFPQGGPQTEGYPWTTFAGEWYFEIPNQAGRVRVRVQKAVANPSEETVLLLIVSARGEVQGDEGKVEEPSWSHGLDLGHDAAGRVFRGLTSSRARSVWGERQ